jgi:iron complex outermembrane receptor protein
LPLLVYRQGDARFTGIDLKADFHLGEIASGDLDINVLFDVVRAELIEGENSNLPRIPPRRIGLGVAWTNLNWVAKFNYQRVSEQQDVANFELATPSYEDFSIYLKRDLGWGNTDLSLFIHGRNLSDQEQRHHASFIKDLAPALGRRFELGVRLQFKLPLKRCPDTLAQQGQRQSGPMAAGYSHDPLSRNRKPATTRSLYPKLENIDHQTPLRP